MLVSRHYRHGLLPGISLKILTITAQKLEHLDKETIIICILKLITVGFWINISQYFIVICFVF